MLRHVFNSKLEEHQQKYQDLALSLSSISVMEYLLSSNIDPVTVNPYQCLTFLPSSPISLTIIRYLKSLQNIFFLPCPRELYFHVVIHPHTQAPNVVDEVKTSGRIHEGKICVPPLD